MYEIICGDSVVGTAEVKIEGLYYRFLCRCTPPDEGIYRIHVSDGTNLRDLGICVPEGDRFMLIARVPVKYLKEDMTFRLTSAREEKIKIPVATGEPFDELDKLESARFQIENGQPGILIDPVPDQPDSDRNQEYEHKFP